MKPDELRAAARHKNALAALAMLLLVFACIHEFSWQALPWKAQGQWRAVTQWFLFVCTLMGLARLGRDAFLSAVCLAVAMMSSTTAICSAAWLIHPWQLMPGRSQCSQWLSFPVLLLSALAALACLLRWRRAS